MYKYILESVEQMNWLGVIPLLIFFTFFVILLIRVMRQDKGHIEKMEQLPFDND